MCGICGWYIQEPQAGFEEQALQAMRDAMLHRGPDEAGSYVSARCGLGHRRLSIIGLSDGQQPMWNEDQTVVVVFNGEIYNYEPLKAELESKGHQFRTHSDTEVLVHLWEDAGPEMVQRLRGMFAFVIYDLKQEIVFGARDRFGQKPFFYSWNDQQFLFASEIKSLLAHPAVKPELNPAALDQFLFYQFIPQPRTLFKGIHQLPAAHSFLLRGGELTLHRYWQLDYQPEPLADEVGQQRILGELRYDIEEAVRSHLISDVPVGLFLSGGLDSSYIAAVCHRVLDQPLSSFSISFPGTKYDEQEYAETVSKNFNLKHHVFRFDPGDLQTWLEKAIRFFDQPLADSAALPLMLLSEQTAEHVKVVLTGDGGDELFAGYGKHMRASQSSAFVRLMQSSLPSWFATGNLAACEADPIGRRRMTARLARWGLPEHVSGYFKNFWEGWDRDRLYQPEFREQIPVPLAAIDDMAADLERPHDVLNRMLQIDCGDYLVGDLLLKTDYATMSGSIEARAPFLDHQLAEKAARLPLNMKATTFETKVALRRLAQQDLPEEIFKRPKRGFGVPVKQWFAGELSGWLKTQLVDESVATERYFRREVVEKYLAEHQRGQRNHASRLYALLTFELWCRNYLS
ncbi:Asparagine synthetase [glutamine-hydrolyzing] 1 [Polystyrenella longa]|uniref:asparagine synthase (glutamine-hydrolyzing) n=1 Tax=Polystyrenella longa TaxID=2528007 RepID=A0A518CRZ5_9PLAN|nr:asparagine synthase (glutamine-hydrolyzing) [Polystyrenella longa]QDU81999.1 Asparagine synthetase [glutamine-hydrolyzing] 1 [Polystyrenella longa]